jgi:hypothetical protein
METVCFSEIMVCTYESTRRHNLESNIVIFTEVCRSFPRYKVADAGVVP